MAARLLTVILLLAAGLIRTTEAQAVFAHVIVGNCANYTVSNWASDIKLASSYGIDAFVLNIATPLVGETANQTALAFQAAATFGTKFKLFFSFDYLGGSGPWATSDIVNLLQQYGGEPTYYLYEGKPFVSTFEGPTNSDVTQWSTIRSQINGGIYFVPDWSSQGPGWNMDLYDGAFSWTMWPNGPNQMNTSYDQQWLDYTVPANKTYMMGVSPWFFTDLPAYNKAWVWRGDRLWYDRWQETLQVRPDFVEIVSWNDFGECHYIGPIFQPGIPNAPSANATWYVNGRPHQAWLKTLPYQIAAYKNAMNSANPKPKVQKDTIVYWYRTAPAAAGTTQCTGNCAQSPINVNGYQQAYPVSEILEDSIFAIAMLKQSGNVSIAIGSKAKPVVFSNLQAGLNFINRTFDGHTGQVTVTSSSGCSGKGVAILSQPPSGVANFNPWVGIAQIPT